MRIERVADRDKLCFRELLLLADEQWELVERYLWRGEMWAAVDDGGDGETGAIGMGLVLGECVATDEGNGLVEIKNLAVTPSRQGTGIGRALVEHVRQTYAGRFSRLRICTGDSPLTVPFYERCGLAVVRRIPGYLTEAYDHPIYEAGRLITDLAVLECDLG